MDNFLELFGTQFTVAAVIVWLINKLKAWLLTKGWAVATIATFARWIAALGAALSVVGISFAFDISAGVLTVSGLTLTGIVTLLWEWLKQYVVQYSAFRINDAAKALRTSNGVVKPTGG